MRASKINLQFFRNHKSLELDFPRDQNVIVLKGENGAGKSSVLEAFYYISFIKSFRSRHIEDLIFWDNDYFRIELDIESKTAKKLEAFYGKWPYNKKVLKLDEMEKQGSDFVGCLKSVIFAPRDILMLTDEPGLRRAYLNRLLLQSEPNFIRLFSKYQKALKHRNTLLKEKRDVNPAELEIWDEELAKYGSKIIELREEVVDFLARHISAHYQEISGSSENLLIEYKHNSSNKQTGFREKLKKSFNKDKQYQITHTGPQRDDLTFFLDKKPLKSGASQGELRSVLLALKLSEAAYIEEKTGEIPILLFDDVFSELDNKRQVHLIKNLQKYQVLISAAEEHCLKEAGREVHVINL